MRRKSLSRCCSAVTGGVRDACFCEACSRLNSILLPQMLLEDCNKEQGTRNNNIPLESYAGIEMVLKNHGGRAAASLNHWGLSELLIISVGRLR